MMNSEFSPTVKVWDGLPPSREERDSSPPFATFEEYRAYCDSSANSFRHLGILSVESYGAAIGDARTLARNVDGRMVPLLTPIEYEDGYDASRCRQLTQRSDVMLLCVPLSTLKSDALTKNNVVGKRPSNEVAIIVEEPKYDGEGSDAEAAVDHQLVAALLEPVGKLEPRDFLDPRLSNQEGHETSWMALYGLSVSPTEKARRQITDAAELLDPSRVLDLKAQYDSALETLRAETPYYDAERLRRDQESLKRHLVDEYVRVGRKERTLLPAGLKDDTSMQVRSTVPREVTAGIRNEIERRMDLSYDELEAGVGQPHEHGSQMPGYPARDFDEAWEQYRQERRLPPTPAADSNDVYAFNAGQLRDSPGVVDALWAISQEGFGETLGAYHPVSMEETREFFESQLFADGAHTIVRFQDGKPVCFGSLTFDLDECGWLNQKAPTLRKELVDAKTQGEKPVFFSEVISGSDSKASYATGIFALATELAVSRTGQPHHILFESTNLSSCFIPMMVTRLYGRSPVVHMTDPQRGITEVDRLDYWYLVAGS